MTFRPTAAFQRALPLASALVLVAILLSRADVLLLAVPFLVWLGWSVAARPRNAGGATLTPTGRVAIAEGDAVAWRVDADVGVVATAWPPTPSLTVTGNASVGQGGVSGEMHPGSWGRYALLPPVVSVTDDSAGWRATPQLVPLTITVTPAAETLEHAAGVARPLGISGSHTSVHRGTGSALATVRAFQPGDRLRQLHWRVTARTGTPHVVATHSDRDTDVLLVLDTLGELGAGTGDSSLDLSVRAMTSITQHYVQAGDRVTVHDLGTWIGSVPAGTGQRQMIRVADAGARADRTRRTPSEPLLLPSLRSGTLVFLISPLMEPAVQDEAARLRHLGGEVVCIDVLPHDAASVEAMMDNHEGYRPEALLLLRAQRATRVQRLQEMGIPVAQWTGPGSLAAMTLAMNAARTMPRWRP